MTAVSNSSLISKSSPVYLSAGSSLKSVDRYATIIGPNKLSFSSKDLRNSSIPKRTLTVQAKYSDGPSKGTIFVGGFVLGGLIVGALGCAYAPQISEVLAAAATEKDDLMKKLPKFIPAESSALSIQEQRRNLYQKIDQLHSAMDKIASKLPPEELRKIEPPKISRPPKFNKKPPSDYDMIYGL